MRQSLALLTLSVMATGVIVANRFVSTAGALTVAAAGNTYGVSESAGAIGERVPLTHQGSAVVETAGAIAAGSLVEAGANGTAALKAAGVTLGRLAPGESATAAGQFVEVILAFN